MLQPMYAHKGIFLVLHGLHAFSTSVSQLLFAAERDRVLENRGGLSGSPKSCGVADRPTRGHVTSK